MLNRLNLSSLGNIEFPVVFEGRLKFTGKDTIVLGVTILDEKLFVNKPTEIACYDTDSREMLWKNSPKTFTQPKMSSPMGRNDGKVFMFWESGIACIDSSTGSVISFWESNEHPLLLTNEYWYGTRKRNNSNVLVCRNRENGEEVRITDAIYNRVYWMGIEDDILLIFEAQAYQTRRESTGELLWKSSIESWLNEHAPSFKYKKVLSTYYESGYRISCNTGPFVDGVFYLGVEGSENVNLLTAIDVESGQPLWLHEYEHYPHRDFIYHRGKLYLGGMKICCIDAGTGEFVYGIEEPFTPIGCHLRMVNDFLIGGCGRYLTFFDIEKREFVWRYKHRERKDLFSGFQIVKDQLISYDTLLNEIYFLRSKPTKQPIKA